MIHCNMLAMEHDHLRFTWNGDIPFHDLDFISRIYFHFSNDVPVDTPLDMYYQI